MRPYKVTFSLYAENEEEIRSLQRSLFDFVYNNYTEGIYVTAERVSQALARFADNPFIKQFLK